jgi:hypothetical protein
MPSATTLAGHLPAPNIISRTWALSYNKKYKLLMRFYMEAGCYVKENNKEIGSLT